MEKNGDSTLRLRSLTALTINSVATPSVALASRSLRKLRLYRQSPLRKLCNTIGQSLKTFKGKRTLRGCLKSQIGCKKALSVYAVNR